MLLSGVERAEQVLMASKADKPLELSSTLSLSGKDPTPLEFHLSPVLDDEIDVFGADMSATGDSSPFIKDEPDDWFGQPTQMMSQHQNFGMQPQQQHRFGQIDENGVDPSELSNQNGNFSQFNFNGQPNTMSSSFNMGNSGIATDDLLDLDLSGKMRGQLSNHPQGAGGNEMQGFFADQSQHQPQQHQQHQQPDNGQHQVHQMFTNTPTGEPLQSPFLQGAINFGNYQQQQQQRQHVSPHIRPVAGGRRVSGQEYGVSNGHSRPGLSHVMDRKLSDTRSPMTPKTPAISGLNLGTPDSGSLPSQSLNTLAHRHQKSLSGQWDSTPASLHSFAESPLTSPTTATIGSGVGPHPNMNHAQLSEVLKSGKHASLPSKVDHHQQLHHPAPPTYQSQEAKRRRRRESHNMVERRRRDNINERIQELSHLVPHHRLEDEKVRKHLATNGPMGGAGGPMSPTLAATQMGGNGSTPHQATSLLANGGGRRATGTGTGGAGSITMGIPLEEKDKGPNKGDILNGSVSWTRDLMWSLYRKLQQEAELKDLVSSLGGAWPFDDADEDDARMRTELMDAMEKNDPESFIYSRGMGSGLRVPKHTNIAGEPLNQQGQQQQGGNNGSRPCLMHGTRQHMGTMSPQSLSPSVQAVSNSGSTGQPGQQQQQQPFWGDDGTAAGGAGITFKEEDEYDMQMN